MNYEVSTRSKSRPERVQKKKNCQRQEASCKHAESRPIHIAVNGKHQNARSKDEDTRLIVSARRERQGSTP